MRALRTVDKRTLHIDSGNYVCGYCVHVGGSEDAYRCAAFASDPYTYPRRPNGIGINEGQAGRHEECQQAEFRHSRFAKPGTTDGMDQRQVGEWRALWMVAIGANLLAETMVESGDDIYGYECGAIEDVATRALQSLAVTGDEQAVVLLQGRHLPAPRK